MEIGIRVWCEGQLRHECWMGAAWFFNLIKVSKCGSGMLVLGGNGLHVWGRLVIENGDIVGIWRRNGVVGR